MVTFQEQHRKKKKSRRIPYSYDDTIDLSAAVDVYSDWVDACDAVAKTKANNRFDASDSQAVYSRGSPASPRDGADVDLAPEDL